MGSNIFQPRSRQEDERGITRVQRSFNSGVYTDIPSSNIPEDGLAYLKNFKNLGYNLVARTGSKEWGNGDTYTASAALPYIVTGINFYYYIEGNNRICSVDYANGYSFTSDDVGNWIVFSDGTHEKIITVTSSTSITTRTEEDETVESVYSSSCSVRGQVNSLYFHKLLKKIILHIGEEIYIAHDLYISSWDLAICESSQKPENSYSVIDEINNDVIIFNRHGIYRMDLLLHPDNVITYFKVNSLIPQEKLSAELAPDTGNLIHRYVYTYSKIKETLPRSNTIHKVNRQTVGTTLLVDSGSNKADQYYIDYREYYNSSPLIDGLQLSKPDGTNNETQWDYFSIWRTADIGVSGLNPTSGVGNNSEAYIWVDDRPICQAFKVSGGSHLLDPTSNIITFNLWMTNSTASYYSLTSGTVYGYITVQTDDYAPLNKLTQDGSTILADIGNLSEGDSVYYIGASSGALLTASGNILTPLVGDSFTVGSIGERIFMSDGYQYHITGVSGVSGIIAETANFSTTKAGCWGQGNRFGKIYDVNTDTWIVGYERFKDSLTDDDLLPRITAYPLYQRFYENIIDSNIGIICPGWLITALRDTNQIYYSQIPTGYEYLMGYHHPLYQISNVKDSIRAIEQVTDRAIIYCSSSTNVIPYNSVDEIRLDNIGIAVSILSNVMQVDSNIGVIDYNSIVNIDIGRQIMITNEPAIRIFDGVKYGPNIASQKFLKVLRKLQPSTTATYTPYMGYTFWGNDE